VFNLLGQNVGTLFEGRVSGKKVYTARFVGTALPSGIYFSRLEFVPEGSGHGTAQVLMRKMTMMK
jgi:hypothetical protein